MKNIYLTKKIRKRHSVATLTFLGVIAAFIISTVYFAIYGAIVSDKLVAVEKKEDELTRVNRSLSSDLVKSNSLTSLVEESATLGFNKPSDVLYLREEETVASIR